MDSEWADMAQRLAGVIRRREELKREMLSLAVEQEKLEHRLAEMLDASERPARIPPWAEQRRQWSVQPGHGAETAALQPGQRPLSELSTAMPCPSDCVERQLHSHFADGVVLGWQQKSS